jgi:hypothetical protein
VASPRDLARLVGGRDSGATIDIDIVRDGSPMTLSVVLGALEQAETRAALTPELRRFARPFEQKQSFFRR